METDRTLKPCEVKRRPSGARQRPNLEDQTVQLYSWNRPKNGVCTMLDYGQLVSMQRSAYQSRQVQESLNICKVTFEALDFETNFGEQMYKYSIKNFADYNFYVFCIHSPRLDKKLIEYTRSLYDKLIANASLEGKPKLFFVQINAEPSYSQDLPTTLDPSWIPTSSDFLLVYCSSGLKFLEILCKVISEMAHTYHVQEIVTLATKRVKCWAKPHELVYSSSTLNKLLYLQKPSIALVKSSFKKNLTTPTQSYKFSTSSNSSSKRGICIILNYQEFETDQLPFLSNGSQPLKERAGSQCDVRALKATFGEFLNYDYRVYNNKTYEETVKLLNDESKCDYSAYDTFVLCLLSHGDVNKFCCKDKDMELNFIFNRFDKCVTLLEKTKIFLIQKCQGSRTNYGKRLETDNENIKTNHRIVPTAGDSLIFYSSLPGFVSYRDPKEGSLFIQTICEVIQDRCYNRPCNIYTLCSSVIEIVNEKSLLRTKCCQLANFTSTLRQPVFIGPAVPVRQQSGLLSTLPSPRCFSPQPWKSP